MYLGIDQSLRSTGVALVEADGSVVYTGTITPGKLTGVERLAYIRRGLREALSMADGARILSAALEGYSYGSTGTLCELGEVGAVVRLVLYDAGVPFVVVAPAQLKQFVAGNGQAKKEDVREAVLKKWGISIDQDDECDAFGLAQLAKSYHNKTGTTRGELEVLKKLRTPRKKRLSAVPAVHRFGPQL